MSQEKKSVQLSDGRFVKYRVTARPSEPFYFVYFRGVDGKRLEKSTGQSSRKRADDRAIQIIQEEFAPRPVGSNVTWDEAVVALTKAMLANNNRPSTIDDYLDSIRVFRAVFPSTKGPAEVTPRMAKAFKAEYQSQQYYRGKRKAKPEEPANGKPASKGHSRKPQTLNSRLRKLRVIWSRWFIKELEYFADNPWKDVTPPKLEKLTPRYLTPDEIQAFFAWLSERWQGWRLPTLFFTVKSFLGNRILELCSLTSDQLQEGRIVFPADETKGRKERKAILPPEVFAEIQAISGPTYVWEAFPCELRERLKALERPWRKVQPQFSPKRLKWWLQDEIDDYCKAHPEVKRFSAHAFRKRAMTEAWRLGIPLEKAAIAFGCNPNTMRKHYIALDETATADEVLTAIAEVLRPGEQINGFQSQKDEENGAGQAPSKAHQSGAKPQENVQSGG